MAGAGGPAGTGAGGPVVAGTWFLAVAEVYAPFEETEGDPQSDISKFDQISETITEVTSSRPLGHAGATGGEPWSVRIQEGELFQKMAPIAQTRTRSRRHWTLSKWGFLPILATSVFKKMCEIHPQVRTGLVPCAQRLVSADSSPLTVMGRINLNVAFPGLRCDMCCVVASIGTDGLLGTEALQSCLPHQLDLRTGQLWADGRSTLQLHQQTPTPKVSGSLITAVVLPPDSEVVANFSINGGLLGTCALIDPNWDLTEEFGVVVGHTLAGMGRLHVKCNRLRLRALQGFTITITITIIAILDVIDYDCDYIGM